MLSRNRITQFIIAFMMIVIGFLYYRSELQVFPYKSYDSLVSQFEEHNAELDKSVVQTRFGLIKHYDFVNKAMHALYQVDDKLESLIHRMPNEQIEKHAKILRASLNDKRHIVDSFKTLNPIVINAINDFSILMAQIIENEANITLIENIFDKSERTLLIDKVNKLFRGVLIYTNSPTDGQLKNMLALIDEMQVEIKHQKEPLENLDKALTYGLVVLTRMPVLNDLNDQILAYPIQNELEQLDGAFKNAFTEFDTKLDRYRFVLYGLAILFLIVLHFAFKRLQDMVARLQIENQLKNKAQAELAASNEQLEQRVKDRTKDLAQKNDELNATLSELKEAQDQLIMQEKMASVGMLTTGVAHEIKNPLNFINNFSDISVDLVDELKGELKSHESHWNEKEKNYIHEILNDIKTNCEKIHEHGQRADSIVKNMLMHSQNTGVQKEMTDLNNLIEDNINISYQTQKAANEKFECAIEKNIDVTLPKTMVAPQSIARVFSYLLNNAFYAVSEKALKHPEYKPLIKITTKQDRDWAVLEFYDNGTGIPETDLKKIFEPFYTTKPTGRGNTGLGLSICYDTIVKQHKGEIFVNSKVGEFTSFTVKIPIIQSQKSK